TGPSAIRRFRCATPNVDRVSRSTVRTPFSSDRYRTPAAMIPISRLSVGEAEAQAAFAVIKSGWIAQGKRTEEFENLVANYVGAKHGIACSSATTGLHLALIAAGVKPGDEVICPSYTFIATANSIMFAGATPVFVDIDP